MLETLRANFDARLGGFGGAPKFPHPSISSSAAQGEGEMAQLTLRRICEGGI